MQKHHEFCPADRYRYDFGLCSPVNGFAQLDTSEDAWYYGNWANPEKLVLFSYCEGDCYTTICENEDEFRQEMERVKQWHLDQGSTFGVDPGLNQERIDAWHKVGLGHLLH